ncbi:formate dehydrogenase accessory protein FdhE [Pseudothauera nasutitermitis]|nr:formate dehydrogenase accessory protein FdhE [Pseudothauera nasutitermitis]
MTSSPPTPNFTPGPTPNGHLAPRPASLFAARARRLRELAADAALADWLRFVAHLADAQADVQRLLDEDIRAAGCLDAAGHLDLVRLPALPLWQRAAVLLAERIAAVDSPAAAKAARALLALDDGTREALALRVLGGETRAEDLHGAPLACAALELLATGAAALARPQIHTGIGKSCPVCDGPALVATLETSATSGLRYLHCAHCNTAWHHVRAQCTHCHDARGVSYQSLEKAEEIPLWRAETCDACHAYLKLFDRTKVRELDPVADDLASLELDLALGEAGYRRTGANAYLLLLGEHAGA